LAQTQKQIDSLLTVLPTSKDDTARVKILSALSYDLMLTSDFGESMKYANELKALCEKNIPQAKSPDDLKKFKKGLSNAYSNTGNCFRMQGSYKEALQNHLSSLKLREQIKDTLAIGAALTNIGVSYILQGNYDSALNYFFKSKKLNEQIKNKRGVGDAEMSIASVYHFQGNYPEAVKNFLSALKLYEEIDYKRGIGSSNTNLGNVYLEQDNYAEALKSFTNALEIFLQLGAKKDIANCYMNIGTVYVELKNYDEGLRNLNSALPIAEQIDDLYTISATQSDIAEVYELQKKYPEALDMYLRAIKGMEEVHDIQHLAIVYGNVASVYVDLNQIPEAIGYLNKAIEAGKQIGATESIADAYRNLAEAYSLQHDYANAYTYQKLFFQLHDSVFNDEKSKQITEMKTAYETEKKDNQIALLTKDQEIKAGQIKKQTLLKNSFIGGLVLMTILIFLGYRIYSTRNALKLQTLRNKIASDLHDDVGSTLSSISIFSEIARQQNSEVAPMLEQIGDSSRKMLDAMADIVWTIHPENDQFEKIIERMQSFAYELLGAKNIHFEFEADEAVSKLKLPMDVRKNLYLIFKEAMNNMVKYSGADKASFTISGTKNNLMMLIRDNGKGFDVHQHSLGNGIRNMNRRAEEIKGKLLIESGPDIGTTIQLLLNVA